MNYNPDEYTLILKKMLKPERFNHSVGVRDTAMKLAKIYGADINKACIAGYLHDITKNINKETQINLLNKYGFENNIGILNAKGVWHSITGAYYVKDSLGIQDEDIFNAIRYHTSGRANMTLLEKIIYIADFTEPARNYPNVDELRTLSYTDIDKACYEGVKYCIIENINKDASVYIDTFEFYNDLIYKGVVK